MHYRLLWSTSINAILRILAWTVTMHTCQKIEDCQSQMLILFKNNSEKIKTLKVLGVIPEVNHLNYFSVHVENIEVTPKIFNY